ncbi:hypothetical protein C8J57DRAFT_1669015 [Mycena rebaudengoi]|nr:hypothetical protein C8J57DRAFT_1669015 [Mycena rebaudengoi]
MVVFPSPHRRALPDELFGWRFPEPSEAVPAVVWALETSTDPVVVSAAAGMAINLQWPLNLELGIHVSRLLDTFMTCFAVGPGGIKLREGSIDRAIACGQAYGLLKMIHASWIVYGVGQMHLGMVKFILPEDGHESFRDIELNGVVYTLKRTPTFPSGLEASPLITWYFRVNASHITLLPWSDLQEFLQHFCLERMYKIDASTFADCLFFLNSFFVAWNTRSLRILGSLVKLLYENMTIHANGDRDRDLASIVKLTTLFTSKLNDKRTDDNWRSRKSAIYEFCAVFARSEGWLDVVLAALALARADVVDLVRDIEDSFEIKRVPDVTWVYWGLEQVGSASGTDGTDITWDTTTMDAMGDFFQVLILSRPIPQRPTEASIRIVMHALHSGEDYVAHLAMLVLSRAEEWFRDETFSSLMKQWPIWATLGEIAFKPSDYLLSYSLGSIYIRLGNNLSAIPGWRPVIYHYLDAWIGIFERIQSSRDARLAFKPVLSRVWDAEYRGTYVFEDEMEEFLALASIALANVWRSFDFTTTPNMEEIARLAKCTASNLLRLDYAALDVFSIDGPTMKQISQRFWDTFLANFGNALLDSAERATGLMENRNVTSDGLGTTIVIVSDLSKYFRGRTSGETVEEWQSGQYLEDLREKFISRIDAIGRNDESVSRIMTA